MPHDTLPVSVPPVKSFDPERGFQTVWDSTSISLAQECLRKYYYQAIRGLRRANGASIHLVFGGIFASAVEDYYKFLASGHSHDEAQREVVAYALRASWDTDAGEPLAVFSSDTHKTRENLIRTIVWYLEHYRDDPAQPITLSSGEPAVELTFKLPISDTVVLSGHLDRLASFHGEPYVMDQKTTKTTISPRYFDQFKPNTQMSCYTLAGKMVYGIPVKGVIIDAVQVAIGFNSFQRHFTHRTDAELDEWLDSALHWIAQAQHATREAHFPMNTSACDKFGGCPFRPICQKPPHMREPTIRGDYIEGEWWDAAEPR